MCKDEMPLTRTSPLCEELSGQLISLHTHTEILSLFRDWQFSSARDVPLLYGDFREEGVRKLVPLASAGKRVIQTSTGAGQLPVGKDVAKWLLLKKIKK